MKDTSASESPARPGREPSANHSPSPRGNATLWRLSVPVNDESEDAVFELLQRLFHSRPSIYKNIETGRGKAMVFLDQRPSLRSCLWAQLKSGLRLMRRCELLVDPARISLVPIQREDWAESWKRHFRPIAIGKSLLIKPTWSRAVGLPGQAAVELDPGLSFGTGHHPTTRYCLEDLVRLRGSTPRQSMLDLGTGSGILAIAAVKLGFQPVIALDNDLEAVRIARENACKNKVNRALTIHKADLARSVSLKNWRPFDLVCANLLDDLLVECANTLARLTSPQGYLVAAGIPKANYPRVVSALTDAGFRQVRTRVEKGWKSGTFRKRLPMS